MRKTPWMSLYIHNFLFIFLVPTILGYMENDLTSENKLIRRLFQNKRFDLK